MAFETSAQISARQNLQTIQLLQKNSIDTNDKAIAFELLRLAFFALRLRKVENMHVQDSEHAFRCTCLKNAIFQQILTLSRLGAKEKALELVAACNK